MTNNSERYKEYLKINKKDYAYYSDIENELTESVEEDIYYTLREIREYSRDVFHDY